MYRALISNSVIPNSSGGVHVDVDVDVDENGDANDQNGNVEGGRDPPVRGHGLGRDQPPPTLPFWSFSSPFWPFSSTSTSTSTSTCTPPHELEMTELEMTELEMSALYDSPITDLV